MKNKKLLFFFSDDRCTSCPSVVPTLSRLAKENGMEFESYICSRPHTWQGKVLPAVGHGHVESFYYLANFYDEILYCSISSYGSCQFRREVLAFGGKVLSTRTDSEVAEFYLDIYRFFGKELPQSVLILPDRKAGQNDYAPYCYPDITNSPHLGLSESVWNRQKELLTENGVKEVYSLYCPIEGAEALDVVREGDTYGSVTERIAMRNMETATGVGFLDPEALLRWQTLFARKDMVTLYQDYNWRGAYMEKVASLAIKLGNRRIIGSQQVATPGGFIGCCDDVMVELTKYGALCDLVGMSPRIGFTIQTDKALPLDWMEDEDVKTPWDDEYSDEYLEERIENGDIPVCFLFYASDIGHLPTLPNHIGMLAVEGMKAGMAFPSSWYKYHPEILEQLYIPLEQGGVCPNLEPLVVSAGVGVATEAEGFIAPELLYDMIEEAKQEIAMAAGERRVPRGYYPCQDSAPYYEYNGGTPQYEVVAKSGFSYYITYKNGANPAAIEWENETMTVLRQQTPHWFPEYGNALERLKEWEDFSLKNQKLRKLGESDRPIDWIILSFDTPFYGLTPNCYGSAYGEPWITARSEDNAVGMEKIHEAMQYVHRTGGREGKLFLVKPHELYRFTKLAEKKGLIKPLTKE